jgi:hypothetical protein
LAAILLFFAFSSFSSTPFKLVRENGKGKEENNERKEVAEDDERKEVRKEGRRLVRIEEREENNERKKVSTLCT